MVVMALPSTAPTGSAQERMATPSRCTVQAPHCAMPQPYFVPPMPSVSRNTHNSGVSGSTSTSCRRPLTVIRAMRRPLERAEAAGPETSNGKVTISSQQCRQQQPSLPSKCRSGGRFGRRSVPDSR